MAFRATPAFLGNPNFGLVHINPTEVAKAFQDYLEVASKLTGVNLDDIDRTVIELPTNPGTVTLAELLKKGMKLFDAIVWLTAGRPASHPLQLSVSKTVDNVPSLHEVARAVFYCYFFQLTQARYPFSGPAAQAPKTPNFLTTIMGMTKPQAEYVRTISSFEPEKFDPRWIRYVSFDGFGQETLSRFGLGVAGYRMFQPFKLYRARADMDPALQSAFNFARNIARSPATWDIHPTNRNPDILTKRGNLNKNLGNLILDCFSTADIQEMVNSKVLYATPVREAAHRNYKEWSAEDDISGNTTIFRS